MYVVVAVGAICRGERPAGPGCVLSPRSVQPRSEVDVGKTRRGTKMGKDTARPRGRRRRWPAEHVALYGHFINRSL